MDRPVLFAKQIASSSSTSLCIKWMGKCKQCLPFHSEFAGHKYLWRMNNESAGIIICSRTSFLASDNCNEARGLDFLVLKVVGLNLNLPSACGHQVLYSSCGKLEGMNALLFQVASGQQTFIPYMKGRPANSSPYSLFVVYQVFHQQVFSWGVPRHTRIMMSPVLHLWFFVEDLTPQLPRALSLQRPLLIERVQQEGAVQLSQGASEGFPWQSHSFAW